MARHLALVAFAFASLLGFAAGAELVVTTTADEDDGDALPGHGAGTSLREAVKYANPAEIITFAPALSGQTISVTNGTIIILKSITIDATGLLGGVTINGHGLNSLFHCGSQTTNTLIRLTLTGGHADIAGGGAILNDSVLTINQCTFTNNTANEAGAIFNFTTLIVNNSTFVGNSARFGGAIEGDGGPITLNQCTFTSNVASNVASNDGGAIFNFFMLTLNHCTVVGNQAFFAGGINNEGPGTLVLNNSIVAGNTATVEPQIAGTIDSATGVNLTSGDPMLAPLGNYGGPTQTMPPLTGSPAIDPVGGDTNSVFATDQRGLPRVVNGIVDVGAVEVQLASSAPFQITGAQMLGDGTFQLTFSNLTGASFQVLATTNIALPTSNWPTIGPATEMPPGSGQFQFTDPEAINLLQRFYRVKSP
jgi:CSLREA domain-containing protein